jgi:hypothetical protein
MYLWMLMITWSVVRLVSVLIDWRARIGYERARAAAVVDVLRAVSGGVTILDKRADGAVIRIEIPARQHLRRGA